jgi:hypothetical protein
MAESFSLYAPPGSNNRIGCERRGAAAKPSNSRTVGECLVSRDTSYPTESRQHPSNVIDSKEEGRGERDDGRLGQLESEVDSHLECVYYCYCGPLLMINSREHNIVRDSSERSNNRVRKIYRGERERNTYIYCWRAKLMESMMMIACCHYSYYRPRAVWKRLGDRARLCTPSCARCVRLDTVHTRRRLFIFFPKWPPPFHYSYFR